jgi:hypothetical protein
MRPFIFVPAPAVFAAPFFGALVFGAPAMAQSWQEYSYPDQSFNVSFPAAPRIETTTFKVADDRAVEAHVYAVRRNDAEFKVTVAEIGTPVLEEKAVVDHAIKALSEGGEVKVNIPHRINRVFGRQFSVLQGDGSRTSAAVFDFNGRLYQIEGKSLSTGDASADAIRFVQSLSFTGGGSNRSADEQRAAGGGRGACAGAGGRAGGGPGSAGPGGAAAAGDAAPDERRRFEIRCRRQQAFAALTSSLNAGDLSGAQQAWSSLGEFQQFGNQNGPFAQAAGQIGQALQNGDLAAAKQALASLRGRGGDRQQRDGGRGPAPDGAGPR